MKLYCNITDSVAINSVTISESHDSATAIATFSVPTGGTGADLGDLVTIDLGYTDNHSQVYKGYVKRLDRSSPDGLMTVSLQDVLSRALDYFVVSPTANPYIKQDIETGDLIKFVLGLAGLTSFDFDNTYFIFATGGSKAEINLVGAYDYSKQLADLIAWNLWAENDGVVYLKNRKPFPMDGSLMQPGEEPDDDKYYGSMPVHLGAINPKNVLSLVLSKNERDLRNRIVIYGGKGIVKSSESSTSYDPVLDAQVSVLPSGFYKSVCLSSLIITSASFAQDACDYNLALLNRVGYDVHLSVIGDPKYHARRVISLDIPSKGISGDWYIYSCDHDFSRNGYVCNMVLKK